MHTSQHAPAHVPCACSSVAHVLFPSAAQLSMGHPQDTAADAARATTIQCSISQICSASPAASAVSFCCPRNGTVTKPAV